MEPCQLSILYEEKHKVREKQQPIGVGVELLDDLFFDQRHMKKEIVFNCLYDTTHTCESVRMKKVKHLTLLQISELPLVPDAPKYWPAVQVFQTPNRVSNLSDNSEFWQCWNGCNFVDIDLKNLTEKQMEGRSSSDILEQIVAHLLNDNKNLYAYQLSKSKGLHFIFYFNVDHTQENFRKCAKFAQDRVRHAIKCRFPAMYEAIEEHDVLFPQKKVIDDCSLRPAQPLMMSCYKPFIRCEISGPEFGRIDLGELQSLEIPKPSVAEIASNHDYDNGMSLENTRWGFNNAKWDGSYGDIAWNEIGSWQMSTFLSLIGMPYEQAVSLWHDMFQNGWSGRTSPWSKIYNEFNQAWSGAHKYQIGKIDKRYINFARDHLCIFQYSYPSDNLKQQKLSAFSYAHKDHRWEYTPFAPTYTLSLTEDQYLSDVEDKIDNLLSEANTSQMYIKAGCGTGKTKLIQKKFKQLEKAIIVCHLNSIKTSNYDKFLRDDGFKFEMPSLAKLKKMLEKGHALPDHLLLGWNQFAALLSHADSLNEYSVFIDEPHAVQDDIEYRYSVIADIVSNIGKVRNLYLFSATPGAEHDVLMTVPNALKIEIEKPVPYDIRYYCIHNANEKQQGKIVDTIASYVRRDYYFNPNRHYAIYDNRNHVRYDKYFDNPSYSYLRLCRNESDTMDIQEVFSSQKLNRRILVSTSYGKEGVEYMDDIEDLVVIVPRYFDITDRDIIQFMNRFRRKKHVIILLFEVNMWSSDVDVELLMKSRNLLSKESLMDDRFPEILRDNNGSIMDKIGVDLTPLLGTDRLFSVAKSISYHIDDILSNNIWIQGNLNRLFPGINMVSMQYNAFKEVMTGHEKERILLSHRETLEKYLYVGRNMQSLIEIMKRDELLKTEKTVEDIMDALSMENLFIGKEEDISRETLNREQRSSVDYMRMELERVRNIISLVDDNKDDVVKLSDNSWAYLILWKNFDGVINFQRAIKFAVLCNKNNRSASISVRQNVERNKNIKWLVNEAERLEYYGKSMQYDEKKGLSESWLWIEWKNVRRKQSRSAVERSKGGRAKEKFCTTDGSVRFTCRENMYQYATVNYGYHKTLKQFNKDWSKLGYFRKLEY